MEATQQLLNRGNHLTELLKQPQYSPFPIGTPINFVFLQELMVI
jgi:F0F1-type ATP synthase alpha subunit